MVVEDTPVLCISGRLAHQRVCHVMRYINLRYLLAYLLTYLHVLCPVRNFNNILMNSKTFFANAICLACPSLVKVENNSVNQQNI